MDVAKTMIKSIKCKDNIIYDGNGNIKDFRLLIDNKKEETSTVISILIDGIEDIEINESTLVNIKVEQRHNNKDVAVIKSDIRFSDIINEFLQEAKISNVAYVYEDFDDITHICPIRNNIEKE